MPVVEWPKAEERIAELARTRRGRHRDRALASWRRTRAIELRAAGMSYDAIATELGYRNRGTVHHVVHAALAAREAESIALLREVHYERLELLVAGLWGRAREGDVPAIVGTLRVLEAEMRLLGLDGKHKKRPEDSWPSCVGPATVVAHPQDCRHAGCARHGKFPAAESAT